MRIGAQFAKTGTQVKRGFFIRKGNKGKNMTRLYDRIARYGVEINDEIFYSYLSNYDSGIVISADNAAAYWLENNHLKPTTLLDKRLIPPFTNCFIEARCSAITNGFGVYSLGMFVSTLPALDEHKDHEDEHFHIYLHLIIEFQKGTIQYSGQSYLLRLNAGGVIVGQGHHFFNPQPDTWAHRLLNELGQDEYSHEASYPLWLFSFAFSLMSAKNIELIDHIPPPKLSKKHEKRYGQPLVTYKTIKVNPMRTVQRMDGDEISSPPRQELHIVAGNFADYRDGPGMFGNPKLKGVYWRPQHVRGNPDNGIVVKDYEIQMPDEKGNFEDSPL